MNDLATRISLACIWEATAPKPGNVYRGADFEDMTYVDFLTAATVIAPPLARARQLGVGTAILRATQAMCEGVGVNTSLGTILLLAPLAAVEKHTELRSGVGDVLRQLDAADTRAVYQAIQLAKPAGLGTTAEADVHETPPDLPLQRVMALAADRDLVARQYVEDYQQVFWLADRIEAAGAPWGDAIVRGYLELLAEHPDSLVARKCGLEVAKQITARAGSTLQKLSIGQEAYDDAVTELDFWLRCDGHRRNPGTSADLVAAALYVLLCEGRLELPLRFY